MSHFQNLESGQGRIMCHFLMENNQDLRAEQIEQTSILFTFIWTWRS